MIFIFECFDWLIGFVVVLVVLNFFVEVCGEFDGVCSQIVEMDIILEMVIDGVLVLDDIGGILKVNGLVEVLFSVNWGDMIGVLFIEFLVLESYCFVEDYFDGLLKNGVVSILNDGCEVFGKVFFGGLILLFMIMGWIGGEDGIKYCVVLWDII